MSRKSSARNSNGRFDRFVALIPVRGGSKGIPRKNVRLFAGKPLVYWAVKAASDCEAIDRVLVATDDEEIGRIVESFGLPRVQVVDRSPESASDTAPTEMVMLEIAERHHFESIVLIQATSPLIEEWHLMEGIQKYLQTGADSLLSVVRQKRFVWSETADGAVPVNYTPAYRPRRQDWDGMLVENGAFYITCRERLLATGVRISGRTELYEMPESTYFEMDDPTDWLIAEQLKQKRPPFQRLKDVRLFITDVDGVLTDAGMYYSSSGEELKKFNTRDGKGIELLRAQGVQVMFLTSEDIELVRRRGDKVRADFVYTGIKNKKQFLDEFFARNSQYSYETTAYIGDDVNDLECLQSVGFSAAPADAHEDVLRVVQYQCRLAGGRGCVREICDLICRAISDGSV